MTEDMRVWLKKTVDRDKESLALYQSWIDKLTERIRKKEALLAGKP